MECSADLLNSRGEKDEVLKWNEDMQRWERVWKSSHAASIPRAIDKIFGPLTKGTHRSPPCSPPFSPCALSPDCACLLAIPRGRHVRMFASCLLEGGCIRSGDMVASRGVPRLPAASGQRSAGVLPPTRVCMPGLRVDAVLAAVDRIKASREGGRSDSEESVPEEAAPETLHSKSAKFFSKMSISKQREAKGK